MKFLDLRKSLNAAPKPCYLVTGDDSFVIRSAVKQISALAGDNEVLNTVSFRDAQPPEIVAALQTPPLLAEYRVIKVYDYSGPSAPLKEYLKKPSPFSVLVLVGAMTSVISDLIKYVETVDCNRLDKAWLSSWAIKKAAGYGVIFEPSAAEKLVLYCNRDMSRISLELEKLVDYAGDERSIDVAAVENMVTPDTESKIYELSQAIAEKNRNRAIALTDAMLDGGNTPMSLFGLIFSHFRRLLFVSINPTSDTLSVDLKVKEYAVTMAIKQAERFSPRRLKAIFDRLCELDFAIKKGEITDKNALYLFVGDTLLGD